MYLVELQVINKRDLRYGVIDAAAFSSKNLYCAGLYEIRQAFFHDAIYFNYHEIQRLMQSHEVYKALPTKVSQQILMRIGPRTKREIGRCNKTPYFWTLWYEKHDVKNPIPFKGMGL